MPLEGAVEAGGPERFEQAEKMTPAKAAANAARSDMGYLSFSPDL
jgi:hypothetical protein